MAGKETKAKARASATASDIVTVEVLHPITYQGSQYMRGLHRLTRDVAEFFLDLRVPNRVAGPQPVARLPLPVEQPKMGEVMPLRQEE
jgi:hypothetical protein